jgi:hypothetical protein
MPGINVESVKAFVEHGAKEKWCHHGCGLCTGRMQERLVQDFGIDLGASEHFDEAAARQLFQALAAVKVPEIVEHDAEWVVRRLLITVWWKNEALADEELFPVLDGTWAGDVLERTRSHYQAKLERRRRHAGRQGIKQRDWKD